MCVSKLGSPLAACWSARIKVTTKVASFCTRHYYYWAWLPWRTERRYENYITALKDDWMNFNLRKWNTVPRFLPLSKALISRICFHNRDLSFSCRIRRPRILLMHKGLWTETRQITALVKRKRPKQIQSLGQSLHEGCERMKRCVLYPLPFPIGETILVLNRSKSYEKPELSAWWFIQCTHYQW